MNSASKHDTAAQAARTSAGQPPLATDTRYRVDQLVQDIAPVSGSKPECREFARHAALVSAGLLSNDPLLTVDASCSEPCTPRPRQLLAGNAAPEWSTGLLRR